MLEELLVPKTIGLIAGFTGISIAIYLQMISPKLCPVKYTGAFFGFGFIMIIINSEAVIGNMDKVAVLQSLVYIGIVIGEIYAAYRINKKLREKNTNDKNTHLSNIFN